MPISGGHVGSNAFPQLVRQKSQEGVRRGLEAALTERWARLYGSNVDRVFELAERRRDGAERSGLPLEVLVPLLFVIDNEMTVKPVDFFIRRTGALFFNIRWVSEWKQPVIEFMSSALGCTPEQCDVYTQELETALHQAVIPRGEEGRD